MTAASDEIDRYLAGLDGWQQATAHRLRALVHEADPGITEEWKWGTPVFAHGALVCSIGVFKDHMKMNFFKGASIADPHGLFNAGLEAKASRAIDLTDGDAIDASALIELIREAVAANR